MKKNEFKNGDIIVQRNGELGIFLAGEDVIILQDSGYEAVDMAYNDDLSDGEGDPDFDIMEVYRADGGVISFTDYDEGDLLYERDETWVRPDKAERDAWRAAKEAERAAVLERYKESDPGAWKKETITIIAQAFYGNRTSTDIRPEEMDAFILGYLDSKWMSKDDKIDRTIVRIPGTDDLVVIYNKYQEEKRRAKNAVILEKDGYACKPLAFIPEENLEIYSRCIVCRMNADGTFASLDNEDGLKFMKYLAR